MNGTRSVIRDRYNNILTRTYTNEDGSEYFEQTDTPDQAIDFATQILNKAMEAKYFIKNPVRKDI